MAEMETTETLPESGTLETDDLVALGIGRRGTGSFKELIGSHKDDPIFHEVWQQIMRDRKALREAAEREAAE